MVKRFSRIPCAFVVHGFESGIGHHDLDDVESLIHRSVASHRIAQQETFRSAEALGRGSPKKHGKAAAASQLSRGRDIWLRRNATCEAILAGGIRVERELTAYEWHELGERAMCSLPHTLSGFAQTILKVPKSFVEKVKELDHTKRHQFNFIGSMDYTHPSRKEQRRWIFPFARSHFNDGDLLRLTDAIPNGGYEPLGKYDVSLLPTRESHRDQDDKQNPYFDTAYFRTLAASNFTLCPSGDRGWSVRVWEAAAAGTICVIRSLDLDVNGNDLLCRIPYKFYSTDSALQYRQDVAEYNYRMFIKYQTFLEGDNVPPPGCNGKIVE